MDQIGVGDLILVRLEDPAPLVRVAVEALGDARQTADPRLRLAAESEPLELTRETDGRILEHRDETIEQTARLTGRVVRLRADGAAERFIEESHGTSSVEPSPRLRALIGPRVGVRRAHLVDHRGAAP
jgi:hypothetical protein